MNPHLQRGLLLYEQSRYEQAESEFKQALLADPQDAYTRAMLALSLSRRERYAEAESAMAEALKLDPGFPFVHYARAIILDERNDYTHALEAISRAIELDPEDADFRALQAQVFMNLRNWSQALAAAEMGLELNPEHVTCANLRAMALVKLGRREEAGQSIDAALAKNPENSTTHANQGWTLLHAGQHEKALEHFRESLRLDPGNEWARQGTIEALKAHYFIYSLFLKYFLWMSRQSQQMQWGVIIIGVFGIRALGGFTKKYPGMAPYIGLIQIIYFLFVFLTWTAEPLFNLLLRLNKFGRMVLSRHETVASNWVGAFVGLAPLFLIGGFAVNSLLFYGAFVFGFTVLPLAAIFKCAAGWPRKAMIAYTAIVLAAGLGAAFIPIAAGFGLVSRKEMITLIGLLIGTFGVGIVLSGWIANFLMMQKVRK